MNASGTNGAMIRKRERTPKGKVLWQLIIDEDLRRRFKARCVEQNRTMSEQVEKLIEAWLAKKLDKA
jgi:ParG